MSHSFCCWGSCQLSPLYYLYFSSIFVCLFNRTCSPRCMLITGTWNNDKSNTSHFRQLPLMVWKTAVLMKISQNQRGVTEYQAVWSVSQNAKQVQILLFSLKMMWCGITLSNQTPSTCDLCLRYLSGNWKNVAKLDSYYSSTLLEHIQQSLQGTHNLTVLTNNIDWITERQDITPSELNSFVIGNWK